LRLGCRSNGPFGRGSAVTPIELMSLRFSGKVALVCGAASGIGAAVLQRLHAEGADVVAIGMQADMLAQVAAACGALAIDCDVTRDEDVRGAVHQTLARHGRIDVLVNAAGILINDDASTIDDAVWLRTHDINLGGTMRLMRAVLPGMLQRRAGSIVNVASVAAFNAGAGMASYAASKAGVVALTRAAANAHGMDGVRVNALCPGWVDTPMSQREMEDLAVQLGTSTDEATRRTVARVALGRMASPAEMAAAIAFLASDDASFVTGAVLVADGGARTPATARAI
jgi:NAD(P)-dependent dehydrogenase (short-subunit alcohol dehydrogenase family)